MAGHGPHVAAPLGAFQEPSEAMTEPPVSDVLPVLDPSDDAGIRSAFRWSKRCSHQGPRNFQGWNQLGVQMFKHHEDLVQDI